MNQLDFTRKYLLALCCLCGAALWASCARAEETPGITVVETGIAEAMPDTVELTATVEGNAELAGDAVEKYRGNKRRVLESLNKLNAKGVKIVGNGLALVSGDPTTNPFQNDQANQAKGHEKVMVQERLTVSVSGIDTMSADDLLHVLTRLIDVAKDAGVTIGPGPKSMIESQLNGGKPGALATFKLSDSKALRQQAYAAALKQARAKAEQLAQLAGVSLGNIVSIRETEADQSEDKEGGAAGAYFALISGIPKISQDPNSLEFHGISLSVKLRVHFDISKK